MKEIELEIYVEQEECPKCKNRLDYKGTKNFNQGDPTLCVYRQLMMRKIFECKICGRWWKEK